MKLEKAKFHFIGIGGIGMCGLAELLHNIGAVVTGSDASENSNTERLKNMGIKVIEAMRLKTLVRLMSSFIQVRFHLQILKSKKHEPVKFL